MIATLRAGVIQMNAGLDPARNLDTAERLVRQAAAAGAQLIVLPELCAAYGPLRDVLSLAEPVPGPASMRFAALAADLQVHLCAGSLCERVPDAARGFNTSLLFDAYGQVLAQYRKVHLFDITIPGRVSSRESDFIQPGTVIKAIPTSLAVVGQAICYDLRFPELFRQLARQGMEVLLLPSAFTATTGRDHWETLVRARAIENQCFVLAANQYGSHGERMASYGDSMIIDPWGNILARAPLDEEAVLIADLEASQLLQVRERVPALQHRRLH
jgi:predicted amidohydrolase